MEKLLTIVIPAYQAEGTLRTTLNSLCMPAFLPELDILVVSDGSTDRTEEIAAEYAFRYPESVRVITKENGGHGSGVNTGIREAKGEYLKVMDADDWADREGLAALLGQLRKHKGADAVDLVSSQFLWAFSNNRKRREQKTKAKGKLVVKDAAEDFRGVAGGDIREDVIEDVSRFQTKAQFAEPFPGVQYEKVYLFEDICRDLYLKFHNLTFCTNLLREHGICFDEHCYYEDAEVALYPCLYAKTILFTQEPLYMYRIGRSGQSMDPAKMVRNEANYRLVLESLLKKYRERKENSDGYGNGCSKSSGNGSGSANGTDNVCCYMEHFIARFYAGYVKVLLLLPRGKESLKQLLEAEAMLKQQYPAIYEANINRAVKLLRRSNYLLYYLAASVIRYRKTI